MVVVVMFIVLFTEDAGPSYPDDDGDNHDDDGDDYHGDNGDDYDDPHFPKMHVPGIPDPSFPP